MSDIYASIGNAFVGTATPYYVEQGHFYLESNNIKDGQINHNLEIFINDEFYEKQKDKWLHTGDMVMVQSGHVGHAAVIPEELDNSAAHALIMFRHPKEKLEPYFLNYQFQTDKCKKKIEGITTGNTIKHILASDMQEFVVDMPQYDEQKIIGEYFIKIDNLITLHQRKYDETKELKKYMLQKMFPKNGEKKPEIRFEGFTDDWEQRKVSDLGNIVTGSTPPTKDKSNYDGEFLFVSPADIQGNRYVTNTITTLTEQGFNKGRILKEKSTLFVSIGSTIGKVAQTLEKSTTNQQINAIEPYCEFDEDFVFTLMEKTSGQIKSLAATQAVPIVNKTSFGEVEINVPLDIAEQIKIGVYFRNLDNLITLHRRTYHHKNRRTYK